MKPESQRIALARLCPDVAKIDAAGVPVWRHKLEYAESSGTPHRVEFDPLEDLNAISEVEGVLFNEQKRVYAQMLIAVHPLKYDPTIKKEDENLNDNYMKLYLIATMTPAQRSEAILRALGIWQFEKTK